MTYNMPYFSDYAPVQYLATCESGLDVGIDYQQDNEALTTKTKATKNNRSHDGKRLATKNTDTTNNKKKVVNYVPGGHYHAHLDTTKDDDHLPCCFQTLCGDKESKPEWAECCRICRFATVLYYLNEPEEGGETAFPLADMPDELVEEKFVNVEDQDWYNLSHYCHNSSLVVTPKRGSAIMWYNHFVDEQTGYLGKVDRRSHHGGCDLIRGSKWIANNWIAGTTYDDRFKPSIFYKEDS